MIVTQPLMRFWHWRLRQDKRNLLLHGARLISKNAAVLNSLKNVEHAKKSRNLHGYDFHLIIRPRIQLKYKLQKRLLRLPNDRSSVELFQPCLLELQLLS